MSTTPTDDTSRPVQRRLTPFMITKQHRRFVEFADTVRRSRYIGACYGSPGIGKTLSARTYAAADDWDWWSTSRHLRAAALPTSLLESRTVMWTPHVITTPRQLEQQIAFSVLRPQRRHPSGVPPRLGPRDDVRLRDDPAHRTVDRRRGRAPQNPRPRTAPRLLRPQRHRPDPHRHARI